MPQIGAYPVRVIIGIKGLEHFCADVFKARCRLPWGRRIFKRGRTFPRHHRPRVVQCIHQKRSGFGHAPFVPRRPPMPTSRGKPVPTWRIWPTIDPTGAVAARNDNVSPSFWATIFHQTCPSGKSGHCPKRQGDVVIDSRSGIDFAQLVAGSTPWWPSPALPNRLMGRPCLKSGC